MHKSKITRISLDLETMSLEDNAAIIQIGACVINNHSDPILAHKPFNIHINPKSSEAFGLHVDKGTMEWWSTQDESTRSIVFGGVIDLSSALSSFHIWCLEVCGDGNLNDLKIYTKGEQDITWLKNAYYAAHGSYPFKYYVGQNTRTLNDVCKYLDIEYPKYAPLVKHDALEDAISQGKRIEWILDRLDEMQVEASHGNISLKNIRNLDINQSTNVKE